MPLKVCSLDIPPSKEKPDSDLTRAPLEPDVEQQSTGDSPDPHATKTSAFKGLGLLDRFLAVWILLAMAIGIILGNFVPNTGPALQKGKFVGVSIPIGELQQYIAKRRLY
jgi:ACR3 family arsenite transporter